MLSLDSDWAAFLRIEIPPAALLLGLGQTEQPRINPPPPRRGSLEGVGTLPFYPDFLLSLPGGRNTNSHGLKVISRILNLLGGGGGGARSLFSDPEMSTVLPVVLGTSCVWEGVNWLSYPMTPGFPPVAQEALFSGPEEAVKQARALKWGAREKQLPHPDPDTPGFGILPTVTLLGITADAGGPVPSRTGRACEGGQKQRRGPRNLPSFFIPGPSQPHLLGVAALRKSPLKDF